MRIPIVNIEPISRDYQNAPAGHSPTLNLWPEIPPPQGSSADITAEEADGEDYDDDDRIPRGHVVPLWFRATPPRRRTFQSTPEVLIDRAFSLRFGTKIPPTPRLPDDILFEIIKAICIEKPPCLQYIANGSGGCSTFECAYYHPGPLDQVPGPINPAIIGVSRALRHEAKAAYYRHNTFAFISRGGSRAIMEEGGAMEEPFRYEHMRDPRATRLLDFIDVPEWKGKGSQYFTHTPEYDDCDEYRYQIRHIVMRNSPGWKFDVTLDWDWSLKVDWTTLPSLETLYLEFFGLSLYAASFDNEELSHAHDKMIMAGAKRMHCLSLKRLVVFGLCSFGTYWDHERRKRWLERLFRPALRRGGRLELCDVEYFIQW